MRNRLTGRRDRLLSVLAVALCTAVLAVVASTLGSSLSTSAVPEPPGPAPTSDVSLLGLLYRLLGDLSLAFPSGQSVLGPVFAFLEAVYRHRLAVVAAAAGLTVLALLYQYRRRPAVPHLLRTSGGDGDATVRSSSTAAANADWPPETGPDSVQDAWVAMVRHVDDVETPASRTPAEWRRIAVDAGLPADAVETITSTFRAVQYGDAPETGARRRQVRAALDEIDARREVTDG